MLPEDADLIETDSPIKAFSVSVSVQGVKDDFVKRTILGDACEFEQ